MDQMQTNVRKTKEFLIPVIQKLKAMTLLDVGCGVGVMGKVLLELGYDIYSVDDKDLVKYWSKLGLPKEKYFVINPCDFKLPFESNTMDLAFSFGVIEHVGTNDGHSTRAYNYIEIRKQWLQEIYRCVKPGGAILVGGPNRNFPIDVAHGLDSRASKLEKIISKYSKMTVHKPWGENFLWGYHDIQRYLDGLPHSMSALSVKDLLAYSRVPPLLRPFVKFYVKKMPTLCLNTGLNPWTLALIIKG
jgi:SAM-dependent methyltransferase